MTVLLFIRASFKFIKLFSLILVLSEYSYSQSSSSAFQFEQFANNDELELLNVSTIAQDTAGYIWFGASVGLYRYDAYNFKPYFHDELNPASVSDNNINVIYVDKQGMLWVGTRNGLNCYDAKTGKFQHFLSGEQLNNKKGVEINDIKEDDFGNYWIATFEGLYVLSDKKKINSDSLSFSINKFIPDSADASSISSIYIYSLLIDDKGYGWVATYEGLNRFHITKDAPVKPVFEKFFHDDKNNSSLSSNALYSLYKDSHNRIWTVSFDGSVDLIRQDKNISFQHFFPLQNITADNSSKNLLSIFIDKKNRAWIASKYFGLLVFDIREENGEVSFTDLKRFVNDKNDPSSITNNFVWKTFQDKEGILWIGTAAGISRYNIYSEKFHALKAEYNNLDLNRQNLNCIFSKNGIVWFGGNENILWALKDGAVTKQFLAAKQLSAEENKQNYILSVFQSGFGNLYIGTDKGLFIYPQPEVQKMLAGKNKSLSSWYASLFPIEKYPVISFVQSGSFIYAGAGNGLYKINDQDFSVTHLVNETQLTHAVTKLSVDKQNNIWLATEGGAACYHITTNSFEIYQHQTGDTSSLSSTLAECVFTGSDNTVWVGTQFGLNRFIPQTKTFKTYHLKDGLPDEQIAGITEDKKGNVWITTFKGIAQFIPSKNIFLNLNTHDGIITNRFERNCIASLEDGMILAGADNGLITFYPDSLHKNVQPPAIQFTDFAISTQSVFDYGNEQLKNAFISRSEMLLNHDENFFNISFVALNFLNPEKNEYAYMLTNVDDDWVYCGNKRNANYTNIAPGHYVFKVKASNNDGIWNQQGISIAITIQPAWYQTGIFKAAILIFMVNLIFFSTRFYYRQKLKLQQQQLEKQKAIEQIRSKISSDIHDEIGSQLTKISLMSQRMKMNFQSKKEVDASLADKITASSKEIVASLGEIIWTVNPKHDNLVSLLAYIRNYAAHFFEDTGIACFIEFPENISHVNIHTDVKRNLFLVIKESLNNIVKHAQATNVHIKFQCSETRYTFTIADNGKGIDPAAQSAFGNGLINMKNRMQAVSGTFQLVSEKNTGTEIQLEGSFEC